MVTFDPDRQAADAAKATVRRLEAVVAGAEEDKRRANEVEARCWRLLAGRVSEEATEETLHLPAMHLPA